MKRWLQQWFRSRRASPPIAMPPAEIPAAPSPEPSPPPQDEYGQRLRAELDTFVDQVNVHELPPIFHYWSNRYVRPILESFGYSHPEDLFVKAMAGVAQARPGQRLRMISLGAGNCDTEVRVAQGLRERGVVDFTIECLELNPAMRERGASLAAEAGLAAQVLPVEGDFNRWQADGEYDVVLANQSLHHVQNLEGLFAAIRAALPPHGIFVTSDIIGRNGHMRWPEAMDIVQEFWSELPQDYRYNMQLRRHDETFQDWDCSVEGFEGIRAQDVLPQLIAHFHFDFFFACSNVMDIFIDRAIGHHFKVDDPRDLAFIDRIQARDDAEILAGRITPTHIMAILRREPVAAPRVWKHLTPEFCVRHVES